MDVVSRLAASCDSAVHSSMNLVSSTWQARARHALLIRGCTLSARAQVARWCMSVWS